MPTLSEAGTNLIVEHIIETSDWMNRSCTCSRCMEGSAATERVWNDGEAFNLIT